MSIHLATGRLPLLPSAYNLLKCQVLMFFYSAATEIALFQLNFSIKFTLVHNTNSAE